MGESEKKDGLGGLGWRHRFLNSLSMQNNTVVSDCRKPNKIIAANQPKRLSLKAVANLLFFLLKTMFWQARFKLSYLKNDTCATCQEEHPVLYRV